MFDRSTCVRTLLTGLVLATVPSAQFLEPEVEVLYVLRGEAMGDNFGILTEAIGDLDGDGVQEFVVTAPLNDEGAMDAGKAYLYSGKGGALIRSHVNTLPMGNTQRAGRAGDLDGDGVFDYLIAAWPNRPGVGSGQVWAYSGSDGALLQAFTGENLGDEFGHDVSGLADIDGDGWGEIVVGASLHDAGLSNNGRVYVLSARDGTLHYSIDGPTAESNLGHSLTSIPDLDGDGFEDLLVGAPEGANSTTFGAGKGYLYSGATGALIRVLSPTSVKPAVMGAWISSPRIDVTGDGLPEALMTDQGDFIRGPSTGRLSVFDGTDGALLWSMRGTSRLQGFGASDNIGDVTGDGIDDLVVSSWRSPDGGAAFTGKVDVVDGALGQKIRTITSTDPGSAFGGKPCGIGDVDGDGLLDLLVNSPLSSEGGSGRGKVTVIRGRDHRPACLSLSIDLAPVVGQASLLTLSGGIPGETAAFFALPPVWQAGSTRGVDRQRVRLGYGTFDGSGVATFPWTPSAGQFGLSLRLLGVALQREACRSPFLDYVVR